VITQSQLKQHLHYDPDTGVFTRLVHMRRSEKGSVVGDVKAQGYRYIGVCGDRHRAHRLAFLYMTGAFPTEQVDHIDGDRDNNRWANLREANNAENARNMRLKKNNSSGICGVSRLVRKTEKWRARITVSGSERHLGVFDSLEKAIAARMAAQASLGFHANHGSVRNGYPDI